MFDGNAIFDRLFLIADLLKTNSNVERLHCRLRRSVSFSVILDCKGTEAIKKMTTLALSMYLL
jgi:hypothetical protein